MTYFNIKKKDHQKLVDIILFNFTKQCNMYIHYFVESVDNY